MARPRAFDTELVLKQSMIVFWTKGYKGTSLEDLMKATQLNKQSFYCAFGDKRSLFLKILTLYRKQRIALLEASLNNEGSPLEAIRQVLFSTIFRCEGDDRPSGCLYVSTILEFSDLDLEIMDEIKAMFESFEALLATSVVRGQRLKKITLKYSSEDIAKLILNTLMGLCLLEKRGAKKEEIESVLNISIESITRP